MQPADPADDSATRAASLVAAFRSMGAADAAAAVALVRSALPERPGSQAPASQRSLAALVVLRSALRHSPGLLAPAERLLVSAAPGKWPASPASAAELRSVLREAEAEEGPARSFALFARGFAHEHGVAGAKRDARAATALYRRAAAGGGTAAALLALGWMLDAASGGPAEQRDARESRRLYERAAALGNAQAMVNLAYAVASDDRDAQAAGGMYRRAASLGHDGARVVLACMALERRDAGGAGEAVALLREAAAGGSREAAEMLGELLARPERGVAQDVREAARLWREAGSTSQLGRLEAKGPQKRPLLLRFVPV
eukprot:m51a1_g4434 hypothetical protein (316) ;mRNA; f:86861-87808